jgi:hypothetical protein
MKKSIFYFSFFLFSATALSAQGLKGIIKKATTKDSSGQSAVGKVLGGNSGTAGLSNADIINGLKEALSVGTRNSTARLSSVDGFFKDAVIKILMPPEALKVEKTLRGLGMGNQVDNAILSMNRAAEDAAKSAAPVFMAAIRGITIGDGLSILKGGDFAATDYLRGKTTVALTEAFRPIIEASVAKVGATKYWTSLFTTYNKISREKVNTDLSAYVTEKALTGFFYQVAQEEQKIRKDPAARVTETLKKVFGK